MLHRVPVILAGLTAAHLVALSTANGQMILPHEPSSDVLGLPVNSTPFRDIDTTGDGFMNIPIGIPYYDEDSPDFGEVVIYATNKDITDAITIQGSQLNDGFGYLVVGSPDLSSNGSDDLIISAPAWSNGTDIVGQVSVHQGSNGAQLYTVSGDEPWSGFGASIAVIGDISGNGVSDFAVGAPAHGPHDTGRVYLYDGLNGNVIATIDGSERYAAFGASISPAGDINGDGFVDILVGAPNSGIHEVGAAYLYSGLDFSLIMKIEGRSYSGKFGTSVAGGEDVSGNGLPDIVIGAPMIANAGPINPDGTDPISFGRVYIFGAGTIAAGGNSLTVLDADVMILPFHANDESFGGTLTIGNDVSADSLPNIIISSLLPFEMPESPTGDPTDIVHRVNIVSGVDGSKVHTYRSDADAEELEAGIEFDDPYTKAIPICPTVVLANCPAACGCARNAIQTRNSKSLEQLLTTGMKTAFCTGLCGASLFCGPPCVLAACVPCLSGVGLWHLAQNHNIREEFIDNWVNCFASEGCAAPPPPTWTWQP